MSSIVSATVPASDFALSHTMESLPGLMFEVEQIVTSGDRSVMPLLWVRGGARERVERTLDADATVDDVALISDFEEEWFFQMEWVDRVDLVVQIITNSEATILDAVGRKDRWKLRVFYPERSLVSETHEFCEDHGIQFDVDSIREMDGEPSGRYGLTAEQHAMLIAAEKRGYFEVPQEVTLEELAAERDVSHQAASERLRRATSALVEDALFVGLVTDEFDSETS